MQELKTKEDLDKIVGLYDDILIGTDISFVDNEGVKGFSNVALIPVIQLHSDVRNIKDLFYTALGKAIGKAKSVNSSLVFVMCNNDELSEQLQKKENFKELGFKILFREV